MSQARVMTIALNRRMSHIKAVLADKPVDQQLTAYLKIVRRNEYERHTLAAAACNCARAAILKLCGDSTPLIKLPDKVLTAAERGRCRARGNDIMRAAFNRWWALEARR